MVALADDEHERLGRPDEVGSGSDEQQQEPRRNIAIRIARAYDQACADEYALAEPERMRWDERPILYRARLANVFENLLARGVIKP